MTSRSIAIRIRSSIAGLLVGLSAVTPAMAATLDPRLPPRELLLSAAAVLLVIALALRIMRRREMSGPAPDGPDLRWWKNP